ncbi:hypothetical protein [Paenibacillus donghaensis]|uniref:Uncharacterized protein n=1 Tax=Paenibacillus donghaensis TaxID=414771 RepID=A0A2Z2KLA5_9BACL|nr:hypothetical protein [Paenibacillus donghaensis]ASA21822.1 hypothetical protein B9T62_14190 [Paenibacillus donghaensis]
MTFLSEITDYKNTIMNRVLEDQELCKAIFYTDQGFLEQENIEDTSDLIHKNIFPHRFIPNISEDAKTYITLSMTNYRLVKSSYKSGLIAIYMFTHRDLFKTDYGYSRMDFILTKIEELMNNKRGLGIGKLEFAGLNEYVVNEKFQGYVLSYQPMDFN